MNSNAGQFATVIMNELFQNELVWVLGFSDGGLGGLLVGEMHHINQKRKLCSRFDGVGNAKMISGEFLQSNILALHGIFEQLCKVCVVVKKLKI